MTQVRMKKAKKRPPIVNWRVSISLIGSDYGDVYVKARTMTEAKKKAYAKIAKKSLATWLDRKMCDAEKC